MKSLTDYAIKTNRVLKLNEKWYGEYPLLYALKENNIEVVKLFMAYTNENEYLLEINDYCKNLLLKAVTTKNNIEMVKLFIYLNP